MKATGIVRRIDDLGRIVIPREIRRTMKIREGDPLEVFLDQREGMVCFHKYSPMGDAEEVIKTAEKMLAKYGVRAAIYDRDGRLTDNRAFPEVPMEGWERCLDGLAYKFCDIDIKVHNIYVNGEVYGYIAYMNRKDNKGAEAGVIAAKRFIAAVLED